MAAPSARWTNEPRQGSAFQELLVLPTFAPRLARPYYTPGTPEYHAVEAARRQEVAAAGNQGAQVEGNAQAEGISEAVPVAPAVDDTPFFVLVTAEWLERNGKATRGARSKKCAESKNTPDQVKILCSTRAEFTSAALSAHNLQNTYVAGAISGPNMKVSWNGSLGGKTGAPLIQDDQDWKTLQQQLREQTLRSKSKPSVCVTFDLETMEGYKNRKHALSPHSTVEDNRELEHREGTRVPHLEMFSAEQTAQAGVIEEIKGAWSCEEHGACFITKESEHIQLNRFRLNAWSSAVMAGKCIASEQPPRELLQSWTGNKAGPSSVVARGRSGPHPSATPDTSTSAPDATALMMATMFPIMTMMAQNVTESLAKKSKAAHDSPPSSPIKRSSPPPPISDQLDRFLDAFSKAKQIPADRLQMAHEQLHEARYMPDIIGEPFVEFARLKELTGLVEGEVYSLKKFAAEWSGKVAAKRARRSL